MWFNPIMKWMLKSPLHFLISKSTMLVTFQGRKSGRYYTTPVSYLEIEDSLYTISSRDRVWWRNLREGAEVKLHLRSQDVRADTIVIEDQEQVRDELFTYLQSAPNRAKYFEVRTEPSGAPDVEDIRRLSMEKVVVKMQLRHDGREVLKSNV